MKLEIAAYQGKLPAQYHELIPPQYQAIMHQLPSSHLALGASFNGRAVGIAVAAREGSLDTAHLLFIAIAEPYRRQGLGSKLIELLENALYQQGIRMMTIEFLGGNRPDEVSAYFLSRCGYGELHPGLYIWSGPLQVLNDIPWIHQLSLPDTFSVHPFSSLTAGERDAITSRRGFSFPPILSPFQDEESVDHEWSLILRYNGKVVGWLIFEPFNQTTILFKTMYVERPHQRMGRGIALIAEACRRLMNQSIYKNGIFFVEADNGQMVSFMNRRVVYECLRQEILWRTAKQIKGTHKPPHP